MKKFLFILSLALSLVAVSAGENAIASPRSAAVKQIVKQETKAVVKSATKASLKSSKALTRNAANLGNALRTIQLSKNKAKGKAGEALTRQKLGDEVAGEQVTLESSKGTRARVDFVKQDGSIVETKTGNEVTPRGANAEAVGLKPNEPVRLPSCGVDRPC